MNAERLKRNVTYLYYILPILLFWHFYSVDLSLLPWFDETYFASVTHSIISGSGFTLPVAPLLPDKQLFAMGQPIFS